MYGKELILDVHDCGIDKFNELDINKFFIELCDKIKMVRVQTHWWVDHMSEEPHLKGVTAVQFIQTSNITIHTLEKLECIYINIFSCKDFDTLAATNFVTDFFGGIVTNMHIIERD